jgi:hypothetical protein
MDMMRIQAQIRQNATEMADYFKDLSDWEKEISQKDKAIKEGKIRARPNSSGVRPPRFRRNDTLGRFWCKRENDGAKGCCCEAKELYSSM